MKTGGTFSQTSIKYGQDMDLKLLVTPFQNKRLPVYDWYSYKHSFSRNLVVKLIEEFRLGSKDRILDPFCGSGTTLLASKEMGIPVLGIDILPLSVFISNVKLLRYSQHRIESALREVEDLLEQGNTDCTVSKTKKELLIKFFREDILSRILFIREWIEGKDDKETRDFLLMALLSVLEDLSYTRKDGGFLRILRGKRIPDLKSTYLFKLQDMAKDIGFINNLPGIPAEAIEGDARQTVLEPDSFSAVITSPPYPNRHDYTRVYLLELVIGFMDTQEEIKTLRYDTLRSHVEARRKFIAEDYNPPRALKVILKRLGEMSLPNRQIIKMIEGYFEDMYLVLKELRRLLRPDGKVAFVVGDVRYAGIVIPVGDILIEIANNVGLEFRERIKARMRGNSPQQMKKYGKEPVGEDILIWESR